MSDAVARSADIERAPLRVLLVEDNRFDVELETEVLCAARACDITVVASAAEFDAALRSGPFDIVLSDFSLPGFSGVEALERSLEHSPDTPFVFVSGVLGEEHAVEMLKHGATDYVVKARLSRLPLVVNRAIAEARERQQRRAAERQLRESESTFTRVIESLQDYVVFLLTPHGTIRACNSAVRQIFGYAEPELIGKSAKVLYGAQDNANGTLAAHLDAAHRRGSANEDVTLVRRDGSTFFANCVCTAFYDDDGKLSGFSTIVRDTTNERAAAEALERAKLSAERASQAKDRFIAVLSHELRTPLVPILTGTQLLELTPDLPPHVQNVLAMIRRNVALEARLIDDLLDVTSIERGKLALTMQPVDVHEVLRAALDTTRTDLEAKALRLQLELDAPHAVVHGDASRLQQVFWNLLRNAVKFTPRGGTVTIASMTHGDTIRVIVRDTGIGISPSALERIFTPFEQADPSISTGFGGLGLGLAIAFGLVQKHGGDLAAASEGANRGAEFTVTLPVLASMSASRDDHPVYAPARDSYEMLTILLVEDNPDSELVLRAALETFGHRVVSVITVADAKCAIDNTRFDVIVSDIGLPDGSGLEVARHLDGRIPAVALSGFGMESDLRASLDAGFADHLIKPVDAEQLLTAIHAAVASRGSAAQEFSE